MRNDIVRHSGDEYNVFELGKVFASSEYFADAKDAAKATVKILAGRELGLSPFAAMSGIHIIKGKPALGANLVAALVKGSEKYDYRVLELTNENCRLAFFEKGQQIGVSEFSLADGKKLGVQHLDKFARNMLFARAMTNGVKWYCPDLFLMGVYTPEELGAPVNGEGEVIAGDVVEDRQETTTLKPHKSLPAPAEDKARSKREKMLAVIADLGGDAAHAATLDDAQLVEYGKQCRAAAKPAATTPVLGAMARHGEKVVLTGVLYNGGDALVNAKVCKFALDCSGEPVRFAVFPKNTVAWSLLVDGAGDLAIQDGEVLEIEGRVDISPNHGTSVVVDAVRFPELDGVTDDELSGVESD